MPTIRELEERIAVLEAENRRLGSGFFATHGDRTVRVPEAMKPTFAAAEQAVLELFQRARSDPRAGLFEIGGQRYVLLRASALSIDFQDAVLKLYADRDPKEAAAIGRDLRFDIAHCIGINDARAFHRVLRLEDPVARLSAGPVHFAYTGWAVVDIKPESNPVPGDDFLLVYDHPYSFEASSWQQAGRRADDPVCIMNAGYSSGWCEESFGLPLTAVEIACRASGDPACTFIMAPPHRMEAHLGSRRRAGAGRSNLHIPAYFDRKRAEEQREALIDQLEQALAKIKTLRGLIPICCSCKQIRDDEGYWHQVEEFVSSHSEAKFSHGLCPACAAKLYPHQPR